MMKIKLYQFLTLFTASLWGITGILTLFSLTNQFSSPGIHLVVAGIFIFTGIYMYMKAANTAQLLRSFPATEKPFKKFFQLELVLAAVSLLLSLLCLSAVIYRTFFEKMAVFG